MLAPKDGATTETQRWEQQRRAQAVDVYEWLYHDTRVYRFYAGTYDRYPAAQKRAMMARLALLGTLKTLCCLCHLHLYQPCRLPACPSEFAPGPGTTENASPIECTVHVIHRCMFIYMSQRSTTLRLCVRWLTLEPDLYIDDVDEDEAAGDSDRANES